MLSHPVKIPARNFAMVPKTIPNMFLGRVEAHPCPEYLEIHEVIKSTEFRNWTPRQRKNIIDSDLVFSPAQVTEHHCVELKDQDISQEMRNRFETLKKKYPEVFLLNRQDIGCTNLVTMHRDMGDGPPIC